MKLFLRTGALLALFLGPIAAGHAAYNPAIVSADARWVIYADFNGLRDSTLGREIIQMMNLQMPTAAGSIGVNLPKLLATIGVVTAYGTNLSPNPELIDGALIAQGTADLRKIAESLLLQGTIAEPGVFAESKDLPFPAYTISDPKAKGGPATHVVIAFPPEPIVLISKSKAQLVKARDVFRGAAASLARNADSPLTKLSGNAADALLFAGTVVPTDPIFPQHAPQARILQLTNSAALALGERDKNVFARADLIASSESNAERLSKILQGLTAMLALAESNDKQLAEFLNSTSVTHEKQRVMLNLSYSSARIAEMLKTVRTQAEGRPVARPAAQLTAGKVLAQWNAGDASAEAASEGGLRWRTIENVKLRNGATITVGRALNGGKMARFERVEIVSADGSGTPLIFGTQMMRAAGGRGVMSQFQFPGADGTYTLKIAYYDDPEGKAKFAVSTSDPRPAPPPPAPPTPETKSK